MEEKDTTADDQAYPASEGSVDRVHKQRPESAPFSTEAEPDDRHTRCAECGKGYQEFDLLCSQCGYPLHGTPKQVNKHKQIVQEINSLPYTEYKNIGLAKWSIRILGYLFLLLMIFDIVAKRNEDGFAFTITMFSVFTVIFIGSSHMFHRWSKPFLWIYTILFGLTILGNLANKDNKANALGFIIFGYFFVVSLLGLIQSYKKTRIDKMIRKCPYHLQRLHTDTGASVSHTE